MVLKLMSSWVRKGLGRTSFWRGVGLGTALGAGTTFALFPLNTRLNKDLSQATQALFHLMNISVAFVRTYCVYKKDLPLTERHTRAAEIFREAFERNGGTFIKLGQLAALLEMVVPDEYCAEMSKLFQKAPVTDFRFVRKLLETELGVRLEEVFSEFEETPIGSASIAQVHKAKLIDGTSVAVKVQHPNLRESLRADIYMVGLAIRLLNRLSPDYNYTWLIDDINYALPQEMDFRIEANNCIEIARLFRDDPIVKSPKVYESLCTSRVLVMEMIQGYSIENTQRLRSDGVRLRDVAKNLSRAFNKMIFEIGFVHGDPHPGNVFIEPNAKGGYKIVLLDHGIYRHMSEETKKAYAALWTGIVVRDEAKVIEACSRLGVQDLYRVFSSMITNQDYQVVMDSSQGDLIKRMYGSKSTSDLNQLRRKKAEQYKFHILRCLQNVNKELLMVMKVNSYLDSIENKLGPKFYNVFFTAKYAFARDYESRLEKSKGFAQKLRAYAYGVYLKFVLFVIRFYDFKQQLFGS